MGMPTEIVSVHFEGSTRQYNYKTLYKGALKEGDRALVQNKNGSLAVVVVDEVDLPEMEHFEYSWLLHPLEEIIHDELADIEAYEEEMRGDN